MLCFFTCFQIFLLSSLQKQPEKQPVNLTPLMSSSPIRVTESSRNYGYNPSPVKPEGLRRPPSKTSMHQSRRLMASAQPNRQASRKTKNGMVVSRGTGLIVTCLKLEWKEAAPGRSGAGTSCCRVAQCM